jgi:hypothetical protein
LAAGVSDATGTSSGSSLQPIDEAFLDGLRTTPEEHITTVEGSQERPHFDIDVISDPYVDADEWDEDEGRSEASELVTHFVSRYDELREPFGDSSAEVVVVRGRREVKLPPGVDGSIDRESAEDRLWRPALTRLGTKGSSVLDVDAAAPAGAEELGAVFRVSPDAESEPLAYVVVLGWLGALAGGDERMAESSEELIRVLAGGVALNTPLHVICVTPFDRLSDPVSREAERLRVSLVLSGAQRRTDVVAVSRAGVNRGQGPTDLAVAWCPRFARGVPTSGIARVRLDVWKGDAEIAFRHDLGSDVPPKPVQVVTPLLTASRMSSSERRLYSTVTKLIESERNSCEDPERAERIDEFMEGVAKGWSDDGYVTLCEPGGCVPLNATRHTRYQLLLLAREREDGYDILLSNHSPLRPSPLSDWNTLLLPAFKDVRALLEHLRDDVLRQVRERAEDFERAAHAEAFEQAVEQVLAEEGDNPDDFWAEEVREVASKKIVKISPTTGAVTEFDYRLVTLLPLVDRAVARKEEGEEADQRRDARRQIVKWLQGLDRVREDGADASSARDLPLAALGSKGCGVRWDPDAGLTAEPDPDERRRARRASPGTIWFPLSGPGEPGLWERCPSIASRNGDVMAWVGEALDAKRKKNAPLPSELLLGKHETGPGSYAFEGDVFPFEGARRSRDPDVPGVSTVDAMEKVRLSDEYDLGDELAYADAKIKRGFLVRRKVKGRDREAIFVYEAFEDESFGPEVEARKALGMLRPVQRYVLRPGLERAREIDEEVLSRLRREGEPWGFARVRKGGAPQAVTVTPPIVEQLHEDDRDDCPEDEHSQGLEFLVCDGNHRVVQRVWRDKEAVPVIVVLGELRRPYYARPFGRLEWEATSDNELMVTPELASKYLSRKVVLEDLELSKEARETLARVPESELNRRYLRDLTSGFGYMGGQGGRYA